MTPGPRPVTSTAAVLAAVSALMPLRDKPDHPGWLEAVTAVAIMADCGTCWAIPSHPCEISNGGMHLARYKRVRKSGLIGVGDLAAAAGLAE